MGAFPANRIRSQARRAALLAAAAAALAVGAIAGGTGEGSARAQASAATSGGGTGHLRAVPSVDRVAREAAVERRARRAAERRRERRRSAAEAAPASGACAPVLEQAARAGLTLPDGWEIHCPGPGLDWAGGSHWGVTCPYSDCPEGAGPYVSVSNPTYYVVAHELCHANFGNDELLADRCAAEHGASLESSPYS